jgi:hypothetical protein
MYIQDIMYEVWHGFDNHERCTCTNGIYKDWGSYENIVKLCVWTFSNLIM